MRLSFKSDKPSTFYHNNHCKCIALLSFFTVNESFTTVCNERIIDGALRQVDILQPAVDFETCRCSFQPHDSSASDFLLFGNKRLMLSNDRELHFTMSSLYGRDKLYVYEVHTGVSEYFILDFNNASLEVRTGDFIFQAGFSPTGNY